MALKNAKFLYNILIQGIRIRPDINTLRQYSGPKGGKDPCNPKCDDASKGDSCAKSDPCAAQKEAQKDPCKSKKASDSKTPCISKAASKSADPCKAQKSSDSKTPCVSKSASKSADPCAQKSQSKDPCAQKTESKNDPCAQKAQSKDPCAQKAKSSDPCAQKTQSKDPCAQKALSKDTSAKKSQAKDPCAQKAQSKDPCAAKSSRQKASESKSASKPKVVCPPPCCPPPCCPAPSENEDSKPICSPAVDGKVAVITGGSVGIGYYCALAILKNGGKVMLGDVKVEEGKEAICKIIDKFGYNKAAFIKCDVTVPKDMECLFNAAMSEFNQIDIVVNNAGILMDKLWEKTVDINVKGVIRGTFLGFQHMRRNKNGGTIVNMASILGHQPFHGCPIYCGSKHFLIGFSRSMGHEYFYKQTGVKVMTMCPGVTVTSMTEDSEKNPQLEGFGNTAKVLHEELFKLPTQSGEACGNHLITILEGNENGSDWISEGGEVYQVKRVDRKTLRIC